MCDDSGMEAPFAESSACPPAPTSPTAAAATPAPRPRPTRTCRPPRPGVQRRPRSLGCAEGCFEGWLRRHLRCRATTTPAASTSATARQGAPGASPGPDASPGPTTSTTPTSAWAARRPGRVTASATPRATTRRAALTRATARARPELLEPRLPDPPARVAARTCRPAPLAGPDDHGTDDRNDHHDPILAGPDHALPGPDPMHSPGPDYNDGTTRDNSCQFANDHEATTAARTDVLACASAPTPRLRRLRRHRPQHAPAHSPAPTAASTTS